MIEPILKKKKEKRINMKTWSLWRERKTWEQVGFCCTTFLVPMAKFKFSFDDSPYYGACLYSLYCPLRDWLPTVSGAHFRSYELTPGPLFRPLSSGLTTVNVVFISFLCDYLSRKKRAKLVNTFLKMERTFSFSPLILDRFQRLLGWLAMSCLRCYASTGMNTTIIQ